MNERKRIKEQLERLDLEGPLKGVISTLKDISKKYEDDGYFEFYIEKDIEYDYDCPQGDEYHGLIGIRLETDEELSKRIADNKKRAETSKKAAETKKARKIQSELEIYKKLHKKYEGKAL